MDFQHLFENEENEVNYESDEAMSYITTYEFNIMPNIVINENINNMNNTTFLSEFSSYNLQRLLNPENNEHFFSIPTISLIERLFTDYEKNKNKNKLNEKEYSKNTQKINLPIEECPICYNSYETTIKINKCEHQFCEDCIKKWLKEHENTCPICRTNILKNNTVSEESTSDGNSTRDGNSARNIDNLRELYSYLD